MAKKSKFGLGLLLGAVGGALAGVLYAPKSGKETREEAAKKIDEFRRKFKDAEIEKKTREIFGKVTKEAKDTYMAAAALLNERVEDLRQRAGSIDRKKYQKLVDDVVQDVKNTTKHSAKTLKLLGDSLVDDWKKFIGGKSSAKKRSNGKKK